MTFEAAIGARVLTGLFLLAAIVALFLGAPAVVVVVILAICLGLWCLALSYDVPDVEHRSGLTSSIVAGPHVITLETAVTAADAAEIRHAVERASKGGWLS